MRLICSQKDLANALSISNKAVNPNSTLPVLNNVLLRAESKRLYFTGTNLEIAIQYSIEADIKNEGEITIPSRLLTNYIGYLKDEKITLSAEEGNTIVIKSSDSITKIKGIPTSEFPPIPNVEKEGEIVVGGNDLKTAIQQVVFAASLNTTRPILAGAYMILEDRGVKMVATDSYRLAEKVLKVKKSSGQVRCIIPAKTFIEVGNILDTQDVDTVSIVVSNNQALFSFGEIQVTTRLIEGQFPNYEQIIPKSAKTNVVFKASELVLDLKRINIFAKENNNKVILRVSAKEVLITTDVTQYGEGEVRVHPVITGEANEIALNSQYILDVLASLQDDEVSFAIGEKTSPIVLRPHKSTDYTYIIMPLKI